jgi:K(+)-stimulated pyrophosphate-energized sodium pump
VDNAGGIAALAGLEPEARNIIADIRAAEGIEAVTNKGFMITATTITALALFGAFAESVHIKDIDISNAGVLVGFFLGACIPFLTASLAMSSLGRLMNRCKGVASAGGTGRSDSACHIDHDAQAAIRETLSPGFIALTLPVLVSLAFGKQALAALLLGCIILGVGLILFLTHEGLWNSANPLTENPGATRAGKTFNPLKDTCVPAINVVIKTVAIICLALSALFY